jgi:integrase
MLARWHRDNRQPDPTKDALVKRFKKGIATKHRKKTKQARPIEIRELQAVVETNDRLRSEALQRGDYARVMRCSRDKALILLAFWRGFRSSELSDLLIENITLVPNVELSMFLPRAKTVSSDEGATFTVPALIELCPVRALDDYLADTSFRYEKLPDSSADWHKDSRQMMPRLTTGPVFRSIKLDGQMRTERICPTSIQRILVANYKRAGLDSSRITSHSARRGFAHWAMDNGWHLSALMQYVGWKSVTSAVKYTPSAAQFGSLAVVNATKEIPLHIRAGNRLPGDAEALLTDDD